MGPTVRLPLPVAAAIFLLGWLTLAAPANADGATWVPVYDSGVANFSDWETNHPAKFYWDESAGAYHYAIADAADDYALVNVPYYAGDFRLGFDVLPVSTAWAGDFRLGLFDGQMRQETASSIYAHFFSDDNGHHVCLQAYWPGGGASIRPCGYSDGQRYHVTIEYHWGTHDAVISVTAIPGGQTFTGTVQNLGDFVGLDRIAMTSIGDGGYPGATAGGYITNVRLDRPYPGATTTVSVPAASPWSANTGVCLTLGQQFAIAASGQWTSGSWTGGPNGQDGQPPTSGDWLLAGSRPCALIGKIGPGGQRFFVGSGGIFTASSTGDLILSINDVPALFGDNSGALDAVVIVLGTRHPPAPAIRINEGADCTNSTDVTMEIVCVHIMVVDGDWCEEIRFRDDPGSWTPWEPMTCFKSWTLPAGDGVKRVCAECRDSCGNVSLESCAEITLDTAPPPPPSFVINGGAQCASGTQATLTYSCAPGVVGVAFKNEGGDWSLPWQPCAGSMDWTLPPGRGRKIVYAASRDACGNVSAPSRPVSIYIPSFDDVGCGDSFLAHVETIAAHGIAAGCSTSPPLYCPNASTTRAQMAVFLCRAAGKGPLDSQVPTFSDVPRTNPYYGWIERIADPDSWSGNPPTVGCSWFPRRQYCPWRPVTRQDMAAFLVRAAGKAPAPSCSGRFADVPKGSWPCPYVERLADPASWPGGVAVTSGCALDDPATPQNEALYCPGSPVTRSQMAVFLVRAFGLD